MIHLFKEAKRIGLMGKDSVWIVTDIIGNMLDYVNASVISSMEAVIGIKTYFDKDKRPFISFNRHFKEIFQSKYLEEYNFEPGIHAIRAFDSIIVITNAMNSIRGNNGSPSMLLENILLSNFTSLSGRIHFQKNNKSISDDGSDDNMEALEDLVKAISNSIEKRYSGFCIDVFEELYVVDYLRNGRIFKTFDAAIGDITILANRPKYVEFTQTFIQSRLTMIVTTKPEAQKAWMFLRPFTKGMWVFTSAILFYIVFIV
ncbi:hypothetical protein ACSBR1_015941 [Camellia fascicularis]